MDWMLFVAVVGNILFRLISWLGNVGEEKDWKISNHPIGKTKVFFVSNVKLVGKKLLKG